MRKRHDRRRKNSGGGWYSVDDLIEDLIDLIVSLFK